MDSPSLLGLTTTCPNRHVALSNTLSLLKYWCSVCGDLDLSDSADDGVLINYHAREVRHCGVNDDRRAQQHWRGISCARAQQRLVVGATDLELAQFSPAQRMNQDVLRGSEGLS